MLLLAACGGSPVAPSVLDGNLEEPPGPALGLTAAPSVYYVAINEPGADNATCDGLSPVDAGNGHCPFRDFQSARTFRLLRGVAGVRVEIRAGVYSFVNEGLTVSGTGTSDAERTVLTNYAGEVVILDGGYALRELVRVSGRYVAVEGLTLRHAAGYNLEVRGGQNVLIRGNRFLANGSSDSLKGDGGAADVEIRDNEFTQWDSQAIDMTAVARWTIDGNHFHDARSDGNAIAAKLGTRGVVISNNVFRNTRGLYLGGIASAHSNQYEAYDLVAERNRFENIPGFVAVFYSCSNCRFLRNEVSSAGGGVRLAGAATLGRSGCMGGCRRSRGISVDGNRMAGLVGGAEGGANVFWGVDAEEASGLSASQNLYCRRSPAPAQFWLSGTFLAFSDWVQAMATDATSTVLSANDGRCSA